MHKGILKLSLHTEKTVCRGSKRGAVSKLETAPEDASTASIWSLDFPHPDLREDELLLFKIPSLWDAAVAATVH